MTMTMDVVELATKDYPMAVINHAEFGSGRTGCVSRREADVGCELLSGIQSITVEAPPNMLKTATWLALGCLRLCHVTSIFSDHDSPKVVARTNVDARLAVLT